MSTDPLLQPYKLKHLTLRNRLMLTSHEPAYPDDGMPKERYRAYHVERAKGGIALTMTAGSAAVSRDSPPVFNNILAYKDEVVPWMKALVDECHDYGTAVMIPESYVPDLQLRLALYRRLGDLESTEDIDAFGAELIDRFGPLPEEVKHLLKIVFIKVLCRKANVEKLDAGPKGVVIHFRRKEFANPAGLVKFIGEQGSLAKIRADHSIVFMRDWPNAEKRLAGSAVIMTQLAKLVG